MTSSLPPSNGSHPPSDSELSSNLSSNLSSKLNSNLSSKLNSNLSSDLPSTSLLSSNSSTPSPLRSLTGALMAAAMGLLLYRLTTSIMQSFAAHPTVSHNTIVVNLSAAIRTLVVGLATMATGIFAFVTLGLVALAIQAVVQSLRSPKPES